MTIVACCYVALSECMALHVRMAMVNLLAWTKSVLLTSDDRLKWSGSKANSQ